MRQHKQRSTGGRLALWMALLAPLSFAFSYASAAEQKPQEGAGAAAPAVAAPLPAAAQPATQATNTQPTAATSKSKPQSAPPEPRDPFLPVDYVEKPEDDNTGGAGGDQTIQQDGSTNPPPPVETQVTGQWPRVEVSARLKKSDGSFAVFIKGVKGVVEAGQVASLIRDGICYRFKIEKITEKEIEYQKLDAKPVKQ